jgi:hypothetical protein
MYDHLFAVQITEEPRGREKYRRELYQSPSSVIGD